ncbi:MAG: extracellular solute-binding protein [Firmicutes bacterium]|nr:extracellular solute-binding protein [Bacillota bacterium]
MRMFRKTAAAFLSLLLIMPFFCAFHGQKGLEPFVMPESFDESRDYDITFWAKNDTNKTQVEIYEKAISDFESLYPNIHVTMRRFTDYAKIYNDVITNIPTLTTPNVCISYPDHIATYMTGTNIVVQLDGPASDPRYGFGGSSLKYDGPEQDEIVDKFLGECRINGDLYALPYMRSTEALYINRTYVEKMGFTVPDMPTWDWVWEVSEAALAQNEDGTYKVNGQKVMIPFIYKSTDNMMITMLKQKNADYSTDEGDILLFNDDTRALLKEINVHAANGAFSTFKISSYPGNFLNAGQCIFGIDSTAGATWMGSAAGHQDIDASLIVPFETVVRPIPQYDTEDPEMISQGPSVCIFNKKDPQEVLASWLFAQFLLTDGVQIAYSQTEGYIPVTTKAQNNPVYLDYLSRAGEDNDLYYSVKIDAAKLLIDNTEHTFVTPVFNGSASVRDAAGALIEEVAYAPKRKITVDDTYIDGLYRDIEARYRLGQMDAGSVEKKDLGPLPKTAVTLLISLAAIWFCIALLAIGRYNRNVRSARKSQ